MNKAIKNAKISINVIMPEELSVIAFIVGLKNGENILGFVCNRYTAKLDAEIKFIIFECLIFTILRLFFSGSEEPSV